jgi:ABC-type dipeptide/oligopeptide/nickel transport system permease component
VQDQLCVHIGSRVPGGLANTGVIVYLPEVGKTRVRAGLVPLVGRRLLLLPVSLFVLATLSFGMVALLPGNPAVAIAGNFASEDEVDRIEAQLGLDRSLPERYVDYLADTARGDLGRSFFTDRPVAEELGRRLPATIELVILSLVVAAVIGLVLGTVGAYYRRTIYDRLSRGLVTVFQSVPDFLLAVLLVFILYYRLAVAPDPVGQLGIAGETVDRRTGFLLIDSLVAGRPDIFANYLAHLALPVLALGLVYSAFFGKLARSVMAKAFASPQVEFARACGLPERQVVRYAFLQGRAPILTYGAILFGSLVGGASIIETVFSWQGAGQWALEAILDLDVPVIQAFILATGLLTIVIYLLLDVLVALLDPRVRYE